MIKQVNELTIRVQKCPIKKDVFEDKYFKVIVPADLLPSRDASFQDEIYRVGLYHSLYERKIWTRQVFKSGSAGEGMESDSALFFANLKKATLDGNFEKVSFMTSALNNAVEKPKHSTRFRLMYAIQLAFIGNYDGSWSWLLDYGPGYTTTSKGREILKPSVEVEKQELCEEIKFVNESTEDETIFDTPIKFVDNSRKAELQKEIGRLIERNKQLKFEMNEIEEAASSYKGAL